MTTALGVAIIVGAADFVATAGRADAAPVISAVGTMASVAGTGTTTMPVSPLHVGDVLALAVKVSSTSLTVSSVSGGGVGTWTRAVGPYTGFSIDDMEIWTGTVSTTGTSTITATFSSSVSSIYVDLTSQEFSATGSGTVWGVDNGAGIADGSSTTVTFPQLTAAGTGELYFGYMGLAQTGAAGSTPGFSYNSTADVNEVAYDTNVAGTVQPTASQSPAGTSGGLAVLLRATNATAFRR